MTRALCQHAALGLCLLFGTSNSLAQQAQTTAAPAKVLAPHKSMMPIVEKPIKGLNPPMARSLVGGLWMIDANYKSSIYLRNNVETDPIAVTPVLNLSNGNKYTLPQVTVPAGGTTTIDINAGLQQQGISSWATLSGYVELDYNWAWDPFCATIRNVDTVHSLIFTYGLVPALPPHIPGASIDPPIVASSLEGMWWKRESNVIGFVSVANLTDQPAQTRIQTIDAQGQALAQHDFTISPHGMKLVNLDELISSTSSQGGLIINSSVPMDKLIVNGGLQDQAIGYSALMPFTGALKFPGLKPSSPGVIAELGIMTGAADPMISFRAGTIFTPYSVLRNVSDAPVTVEPTMWWMEEGSPRSAQLPQVTLAPHQTQSMDVPALLAAYGPKNFNGSFNLIFDGNIPPGSLILASGSVDQTGSYIFEVIPHGVAESAAKSLQYWSIGNGDDTMVTLWNPADEPQDFVLTLFFTGGQYALPLHLGPRATRTFNISGIVMNQVPDANGNIIPASIHEGGGVISGPQGVPQHILVATDAGIYNVKKATCQPTCESCYGATSSAVTTSTFAVPIQQTVQQNFIITWGNGTQTNANSSPWTTTAPSVATVSSGLVSGVSAGSATVAASAYEQVEVAQFCFMNGNPPCPSGNMQGSSPGTVPALSCPGPVTRGNSMTCTVTCGGTGACTSGVTVSGWQFKDSANNPSHEAQARPTSLGRERWSLEGPLVQLLRVSPTR